jgi:hypothetical protein
MLRRIPTFQAPSDTDSVDCVLNNSGTGLSSNTSSAENGRI